MPKRTKKSFRISFSSSIGLIFASLFTLAFGILIYTSYFQNKVIIQSLSSQLATQVTQSVLTETESFIRPAVYLSQMSSDIFSRFKHIDIEDPLIQSVFLESLSHYPHITNAYLGLENGSFLMVSQGEKTSIKRINTQTQVQTIIHLSSNKQIDSINTTHTIDYDPRVRPWYNGAKNSQQFYWTAPYLFFSKKITGITISFPIYGQSNQLIGVVGVDISLEQLNAFLQELYITDNTALFIQSDADLIGSNLINPSEFDSTLLNSIVSSSKTFTDSIDSLTFNDVRYLVSVATFVDWLPSNWHYTLIIPEHELMHGILLANQKLIVYSILILILGSVFIIIFSRTISKPINIITSHTKKITSLKSTPPLSLTSYIKEIAHLKDSINAMQSAIDSFKHYIPKTVVKQLISSKKSAKISGDKKELTMLFSDIENFCGFSETHSPKDVSMRLSDYFEIFSTKIIAHKGTIDKYIGDSIMGFWGAPNSVKHHAKKAATCLLEMLAYVQSDAYKNNPRLSVFHTRFALHTGEVIIGNIGSSKRFNYSAIGQHVNICSRLEGLNKRYGTTALVSGSTKALLTNDFVTRPLETVSLKGIKTPIEVHELLGHRSDKDWSYVDEFIAVHALFYSGQFKQALTGFQTLSSHFPDDAVLRYYCDLAEQYMANPDLVSKNFVVTMTQK